ncbi:MAG: hypothetical protein QOF51_1279 [Chloroflexota bacterium]|nr:hypothetical protein [Chloroflexota bacterium]
MTVFGGFAFAAIVGAGAIGRWTQTLSAVDDRPVSDDPTAVRFTVEPGASGADVGNKLEQAGLVRSGRAFRLAAEVRGVGARIRAGEYELRRNMNLSEVLNALTSGSTLVGGLVTIPEGWRAEEIALLLQDRGVVDGRAFLDVVAGHGGQNAPALPEGASSFEGYLFPDTYAFGRNTPPEEVVRTFVRRFDEKLSTTARAQAAANGFSLHGLVTLASIVEREAAQPAERPLIAAVYNNRLELGMRLQADPTVQYALVPPSTLDSQHTYWKRDLSAGDLATTSPFNTYTNFGLPPAPICDPGLAALEAAANPADGSWLYFVAQGDGSHLFASTLAQHLDNIARIDGPAARSSSAGQ